MNWKSSWLPKPGPHMTLSNWSSQWSVAFSSLGLSDCNQIIPIQVLFCLFFISFFTAIHHLVHLKANLEYEYGSREGKESNSSFGTVSFNSVCSDTRYSYTLLYHCRSFKNSMPFASSDKQSYYCLMFHWLKRQIRKITGKNMCVICM